MLTYKPKEHCKQIPPETALPLWEEIMKTAPLFKKGPIPKTVEWKWEFGGKPYVVHKIREEATGFDPKNKDYYKNVIESLYITTIHGGLVFEFLICRRTTNNIETTPARVTNTTTIQAQTTLPLKDLMYWRLRRKE